MRLSYITEADMEAAKRIHDVPRVRRIVAEVAQITGVSEAAILSPRKPRHITLARDMVCYIAHREGIPSTDIGRGIGRDHSSVLSSVKRETARRTCESAGDVPE
jgi:chromosomal replication initiation ATPase DnaA